MCLQFSSNICAKFYFILSYWHHQIRKLAWGHPLKAVRLIQEKLFHDSTTLSQKMTIY